MNIFEQYGIKEVADVTLYAIELDKYDDEVYIPILYFDTLKVSTVEQAAEQTFAKGGPGNPNLIGWDYGKDITVTLEDALYTPASQSLMWGGRFGTKHTKIYGAWNPYVYPKDRYGKQMYLKKIVVYPADGGNGETSTKWTVEIDGKIIEHVDNDTGTLTQVLEKHFVPFICPCDGKKKYVKYAPNDSTKKYKDPTTSVAVADNGEEVNTIEEGKEFYYASNVDKLERAEIIMDNFGFFSYCTRDKGDADNKFNINDENYDLSYICGKVPYLYEYIWKDCNLKMISTQGEQQVFFVDDADVRFRIKEDTGLTSITLSITDIYNWTSESSDITKKTWNDIVETYSKSDMVISNSGSNGGKKGIAYYNKDYSKKVTLSIKVKWEVVNDKGETIFNVVRVPVGDFYIVEDWNVNAVLQEQIHPINSGLNDIQVLERMEKCRATDTFCINTDINVRSYNYSQMKEYSDSNLTVYIDPRTMKPYEPNTDWFRRKDGTVVHGNLRIIKQYDIYYKWTRSIADKYSSLGTQIIVDSKHFPGTYKLVGETYARRRSDSKDERFQFEIPLCKMDSNTSLTFDAAGDPATYTMSLKVLKKEDDTMMKLTQYDVSCNKYDQHKSGSTKPIPKSTIEIPNPYYEPDKTPPEEQNKSMYVLNILSPTDNTIYYLPLDEFYRTDGKATIDVTTQDLEKYDKSNLVVRLEKYDYSPSVGDYVHDDNGSRILGQDEFTVKLEKVERGENG